MNPNIPFISCSFLFLNFLQHSSVYFIKFIMSLSFTFTRVTMVAHLRFHNINVQMNLNCCKSFIKEQDSICDCYKKLYSLFREHF